MGLVTGQAAFPSQVSILILHTRKRLVDVDNLSVKAAIDGLVLCGVLPDDSPEHVVEVRHRQIKGTPEETRILIEAVEE